MSKTKRKPEQVVAVSKLDPATAPVDPKPKTVRTVRSNDGTMQTFRFDYELRFVGFEEHPQDQRWIWVEIHRTAI
jgi:hypothetical protein